MTSGRGTRTDCHSVAAEGAAVRRRDQARGTGHEKAGAAPATGALRAAGAARDAGAPGSEEAAAARGEPHTSDVRNLLRPPPAAAVGRVLGPRRTCPSNSATGTRTARPDARVPPPAVPRSLGVG